MEKQNKSEIIALIASVLAICLMPYVIVGVLFVISYLLDLELKTAAYLMLAGGLITSAALIIKVIGNLYED